MDEGLAASSPSGREAHLLPVSRALDASINTLRAGLEDEDVSAVDAIGLVLPILGGAAAIVDADADLDLADRGPGSRRSVPGSVAERFVVLLRSQLGIA